MDLRSSPTTALPFAAVAADLAAIDAAAAGIRSEDPALQAWLLRYASDARERLALDLQLLRVRGLDQGAVLDVGAAPFLLTAALSRQGADITAVDLAPERFAALPIPVLTCDIEREPLPLRDARFHCVVFNEVFEHLRIDPLFTLGELRRVLKPGGTLVLSTPNLLSLLGWFNLVVRGRAESVDADPLRAYRRLRELGHMGHVREYTRTEVVQLLEGVGFRVTAVCWRGDLGRRALRPLLRMAPRLRPFATYLAVPSP